MIWIIVMHCGIFWISFYLSRQYIAKLANIDLLGNRLGLLNASESKLEVMAELCHCAWLD